MEYTHLFFRLQKDLQIKIAVEYVGGWKCVKGKLEYSFDHYFNKIPRPIGTHRYKFIYSRGFWYHKYDDWHVVLKISAHKSYVLRLYEEREWSEYEYEVVSKDSEPQKIITTGHGLYDGYHLLELNNKTGTSYVY